MSGADRTTAPIGELLAMLELLDADNERLRVRVLDLLRVMEDAVTQQVANEREIVRLESRVAELEEQLHTVERSLVVRLTRPLRRAYVRVRGRAA